MSVRAALVIVGLAAFLVPTAAFGANGVEQQLAEKYAPVVGLKQHALIASSATKCDCSKAVTRATAAWVP